jgi:hypothetical protein
MKIIIDDVGVYFTNKSKKWPNSLVISRPLEQGRYINIPMENVPALIESLNKLMSKLNEYSMIFTTKEGKDIIVNAQDVEFVTYKISQKPEITKDQISLKDILRKKE